MNHGALLPWSPYRVTTSMTAEHHQTTATHKSPSVGVVINNYIMY